MVRWSLGQMLRHRNEVLLQKVKTIGLQNKSSSTWKKKNCFSSKIVFQVLLFFSSSFLSFFCQTLKKIEKNHLAGFRDKAAKIGQFAFRIVLSLTSLSMLTTSSILLTSFPLSSSKFGIVKNKDSGFALVGWFVI